MTPELLIFAGLLTPLLVRAALWGACMPTPPSRSTLLGWSAAGASLNQVVGYRSGDALRVVWARNCAGLRQALSSVLLLRAVEGVTIVVGILWLGPQLFGWGQAWASAAAISCLAVLMVAPRLARVAPRSELLRPLAQLRMATVAKLVVLSVTAFALEAMLFAGVLQVFDVELDARLLCICVMAATAGQAMTWLPANLGTYEFTLAGALVLAGVSGEAVWQIPVVTHALRFGFHLCLLPTVALCRPRRLDTPCPVMSSAGSTT